MSRLKTLWRACGALWGSGLFRLSLCEIAAIGRAWWRCRNSFAFLSEVAAIRFGSRLALWDDRGSLTFDELHEQSLSLATHLAQDYGVRPGRQVALAGGNGRGFVLGLLACTRLGADVLPMAPELPPMVTETILRRQGISVLLKDTELEGLLGVSAGRTALAPVKRGGELVVLTSGSSGVSKGIRRRPTLGQLLPLVSGLLEALPITLHRPTVLAIPLYHGYGLATLAMTLALGAPLHTGRRYDVTSLMERQAGQEPPLLITVPTLLSRWLQKRAGVSHPAAIITGSAPLPAELCQQLLQELGPVLFNLYGSTEAGLISLASPQTLRAAPGSVGSPLPGNQVRLVDESERDVPPGKLGRILVKGPFALPSREDGWRDTGDLGRLDRDGRLFVCGRADAMIVSGGENVYPHELEETLASHLLVREAAVLVVDDAEFGKRLAAVVRLRPEARIGVDELRDWLRQRLERHKLPRELHIVAELPKNALGKVDKPALERLFG